MEARLKLPCVCPVRARDDIGELERPAREPLRVTPLLGLDPLRRREVGREVRGRRESDPSRREEAGNSGKGSLLEGGDGVPGHDDETDGDWDGAGEEREPMLRGDNKWDAVE